MEIASTEDLSDVFPWNQHFHDWTIHGTLVEMPGLDGPPDGCPTGRGIGLVASCCVYSQFAKANSVINCLFPTSPFPDAHTPHQPARLELRRMAGTFIYRAALRRQAQFLARPPQRRWQSSKPEQPIPVQNTVPPPTAEVPFWLRLGPLTRATQAYGRAQRKRPWVVQLCTSLTIFCLGDISAQRMSGKDYDPERTGRAVIIGGIISIPNFEW